LKEWKLLFVERCIGVVVGTKPTLKEWKLPTNLLTAATILRYEAYLEVRETSQTQSPRLLAEEAHDG
jgi:hypothetical protein